MAGQGLLGEFCVAQRFAASPEDLLRAVAGSSEFESERRTLRCRWFGLRCDSGPGVASVRGVLQLRALSGGHSPPPLPALQPAGKHIYAATTSVPKRFRGQGACFKLTTPDLLRHIPHQKQSTADGKLNSLGFLVCNA